MTNYNVKLIINIGLLIFGLSASVSGLIMQVGYHVGAHGLSEPNKLVLGIGYQLWSDIHKLTIVIFTLLMIFHVALHLKWYKTVLKKRLILKNILVLTLSVLFVLVAITGFFPWIIDLMDGEEMLRKALIEIHDKLALFFFIYLILHVLKKSKWFYQYQTNIKKGAKI